MSEEAIIIDGESYLYEDLSDEVKQLVELQVIAQQQFERLRREMTIQEFAAMSFANMIAQKVKGDGGSEILGGDQSDNDS